MSTQATVIISLIQDVERMASVGVLIRAILKLPLNEKATEGEKDIRSLLTIVNKVSEIAEAAALEILELEDKMAKADGFQPTSKMTPEEMTNELMARARKMMDIPDETH